MAKESRFEAFSDEDFVNEYNARVESEFGNNPHLRALEYSDGVIKGSGQFVTALVGEMLRKRGYTVSTPSQLEQALAADSSQFRGHFEDTGLVLRSESGTNEYLAKNLATQIKARGKAIENPVVIPLSGVEVVNDRNSEYGLAFRLRDDAELIEAPALVGENNGASFAETDRYGMPVKIGEGNRKLYTGSGGLSAYGVDWNLDIRSGSGNLGISEENEFGRIFVIRS